MKINDSVSSKPLFDWFSQSKDNRAKLRQMGFSDGQITNWKYRGVPRGQIGIIAPMMGLTYEQYITIAEAPFRGKRLRRVAVLALLAIAPGFVPSEARAATSHNYFSHGHFLSKSFNGLHILGLILDRLMRKICPILNYTR